VVFVSIELFASDFRTANQGAMRVSLVQNAQLPRLLEVVGVNDRLGKCLGRLLREIVSNAASDDLVLIRAHQEYTCSWRSKHGAQTTTDRDRSPLSVCCIFDYASHFLRMGKHNYVTCIDYGCSRLHLFRHALLLFR